ncbi:MAG: hypothetical protein M1118_15040, partial [Chloroflexi bacterium]|nr:hypothetical protein [Chloroflexota bacterium]
MTMSPIPGANGINSKRRCLSSPGLIFRSAIRVSNRAATAVRQSYLVQFGKERAAGTLVAASQLRFNESETWRLLMFHRRQAVSRKWKLILVSHTHWDREWYLPFQQFRANLVEAVDDLLDLMKDDPEYRYFTLDGQTVVLEDYLEVRPSREKELQELIEAGRVLVGPWYVMPDEFLVSGESLIRNLVEGRRTAARFGPVMCVGYVPDSFGHIAQLPQILLGFGIKSAVLWRGVGADLRHNEAMWESPDGSQVLLEYMPGGYGSAAVLPAALDSLMERISQIRTQLQPRATTDFLLLMNGHDHTLPQRDVPAIVAEANRHLRDAEIIHGTLPMLLDGIQEQASADGVEWQRIRGELRSSEVAHILAGVLSTRMDLKQRNSLCEGLLERWAEPFSSFASLLPRGDWTSTHPAVGQRASDAPALLRLAWRYLLKNHPHDSICGCGVDQVHAEMMTRFDWCQQIAQLVADRALKLISSAVDTETWFEDARVKGAIAVFNSEAGPRTDFVTATVELPSDKSSFLLVAPDGRQVPWQMLRERHTELASTTLSRSEVQRYLRLSGPGRDWPRWKLMILDRIARAALRGRMSDLMMTTMDVIPGKDPSTVNVEVEVTSGREHDHEAMSSGMRKLTNLLENGDAQRFRLRVRRRDQAEIGFVAHDIPGFGMKLFRFQPMAVSPSALSRSQPEATIENEYLSLQVNSENGTVRLIDKDTGTVYWDLNSIVDGGDAGDEYTYSPPSQDRLVRGPASPPSVTLEEKGPARQVLRVEMVLQLPKGLSDDRQARSLDTVPCQVTSWLALYPSVPRVDVRTTFANTAVDHRLRVLFPTHLSADVSHADGHFAVIERQTEPPAAQPSWIEHPVATYPQMTFVDVSDGQSGLMIANRGLPEFEVVQQETGAAVAITLLRAIGWLSRDDLTTRHGGAGPAIPTPGAQMPGSHSFDYSIIPHAGGWQNAIHQARNFVTPLAARWTGRHPGVLGPELSFLAISPATLLVSAVKPPEDGSEDLV